MTQLDVPQVSLSRYLDLLKRRRWQVVPISILGLVIGGIVAFFIPRYFVAKTDIGYRQPPGSETRDAEDPFGGLVDSAKLTMPLAIASTIQELGWPEGNVGDPYELSANAEAIQGRLEIFESGNSLERGFAMIRVTYKDRDGDRAATFLNKLVETWKAQEIAQLRGAAEQALAAAKADQKRFNTAHETLLERRKLLENRYGIVPDIELVAQRAEHRASVDLHRKQLQELEDRRATVANLAATIAYQKKQLIDVPARVPVNEETLLQGVLESEAGQAMRASIIMLTLRRDGYRKTNPAWHTADGQLQAMQKELLSLALQLGQIEVGPDGLMPNPIRQQADAAIAALEQQLVAAEAELTAREQGATDRTKRLLEQSEGYAQYAANQLDLEHTEAEFRAAQERAQTASARLGKLDSEPPVRVIADALIPPAPTDPNLLMVALIGCIVGLLAAIALILLLDLLQATFKTIDDVERGLDVPVLGGVSHLETEAQRRQTRRSRRRATAFAAAVVFLISLIVGIYLYDPVWLPPWVSELLAVVLGGA